MLCDSVVTVLGECWDDTHKSRSAIKFVYRPTVVPSRLLTRRGVFVVFSPFREVSFGRRAIFVCLLVHDTRICWIKAQTQTRVCFPAENQLVLLLSSACRAEHICFLTGKMVTERSVLRIVNCLLALRTILTSQKLIASQSSSARVIIT